MAKSSFWDDLGNALTRKAKGLSSKAENLYEIQKIRNKLSAQERMTEKLMMDIGKMISSQIAPTSPSTAKDCRKYCRCYMFYSIIFSSSFVNLCMYGHLTFLFFRHKPIKYNTKC